MDTQQRGRGKSKSGTILVCLLLCLSLAVTARAAAPSVGQAGATLPPLSATAAPVAKITGSTAILLRSSGSVGTLAWIVEPPEARERLQEVLLPAGTTKDGQALYDPVLLILGPNPTRLVVLLIATDGTSIVTDRFVIPADGVPVPDPTPDPNPPPDPPIPGPDPLPDPPMPVKVAEIIVIYESEPPPNATAEQFRQKAAEAELLLDKAWHDVLRAKNVQCLVLDRDQLPARLLPLKARAAGSVVFAVGAEGNMEKAIMVPLPTTTAAMLELIKKWITE